MNNKKLLGKQIKFIRKSNGYTQEKLSELIGIETSSLSGIESGRFYPSLHVLEKISNVLNIQMIDFFRYSTVDSENIDKEIKNIIGKQNQENKKLVYKLLVVAFKTSTL